MAKKGSTILLKLTVVAMGLIGLAFGIFALPGGWYGGEIDFPTAGTVIRIIIVGMYVTAIPFYIGLWQTWKLLNNIESGKAFSEMSVRALKNIKLCAALIGAIYLGGVPLLLPIAEVDDAPGLILVGGAFACIPVVVAVFAHVLQRLLENAIEMKSENELTV